MRLLPLPGAALRAGRERDRHRPSLVERPRGGRSAPWRGAPGARAPAGRGDAPRAARALPRRPARALWSSRRRLPASARMIWRNLARRPVRAALSVVGLAFAVAILLVGRFFVDAVEHLAERPVPRRCSARTSRWRSTSRCVPRVRYEVAALPGRRARRAVPGGSGAAALRTHRAPGADLRARVRAPSSAECSAPTSARSPCRRRACC